MADKKPFPNKLYPPVAFGCAFMVGGGLLSLAWELPSIVDSGGPAPAARLLLTVLRLGFWVCVVWFVRGVVLWKWNK